MSDLEWIDRRVETTRLDRWRNPYTGAVYEAENPRDAMDVLLGYTVTEREVGRVLGYHPLLGAVVSIGNGDPVLTEVDRVLSTAFMSVARGNGAGTRE